MSSSLPALRSMSIRDSAIDALRNALLSGRFQPGESLSEPALAAQMGVSRGPVREALLVLEQEGLVVHSQNRGFAVLELRAEDRHWMTTVREPLEALALEAARERATAEDLEALDRMIDRLTAAYRDDARACAQEDRAFHEKLWEMSGNPWLVVALKRIMVPFFLYTIMYSARTEHLDAPALEEQHRLYIRYLRGETNLTAPECVRQHLRTY